MSGENSNDDDMVSVSLAEEDGGKNVVDDADKEENKKQKNSDKDKDIENKKKLTTSSSNDPELPVLLLPAATYATVMGRHLIDWGDGDDGAVNEDSSVVQFEWPGVRFSFTVTGTSTIAIRLETSGSCFGYHVRPIGNNESSNPNQEQAVDKNNSNNVLDEKVLGGGLFGREMKDHCLATDLDRNVMYKVEIWKRDDPMGICKLQGLVVDEKATGIKPPKKRSNKKTSKRNLSDDAPSNTLHLEFVGNSDTVGFGNMRPKSSMFYFLVCQMACMPFCSSLYQGTDVTKSWPAFLCQALQENRDNRGGNRSRRNVATSDHDDPYDDVQYSIIAWSGIGAKYSVNIEETMIACYPRILPSDETSIPVSSMSVQPPVNAVLVYLGQNDAASLHETFSYTDAKLTSAFEVLLKMIRHRRPLPIPIMVIVPSLDAAIACASSERARQETCEAQNRIWKALVEEKLGGEGQGFFLVENEHKPAIKLNSKQDFGMGLHWNAASQQKWARALEPKVRAILRKKEKRSSNNKRKDKQKSRKKDRDSV